MPRGGKGSWSREVRAASALLIAFGLLWLLAEVSYVRPGTAGPFGGAVPGDVCGPIGHRLAAFARGLLGRATAPVLPLTLVTIGILGVGGSAIWGSVLRVLIACCLVLPPVATLVRWGWGGEYGALAGGTLIRLLGPIGAWIFVSGLLAAVALLVGLRRPAWSERVLGDLRVIATQVGVVAAHGARAVRGAGRWIAAAFAREEETEPVPDDRTSVGGPRVVAEEEPRPLRPDPEPDPEAIMAASAREPATARDRDPGIVDLGPVGLEPPLDGEPRRRAPKKKVRRAPEDRKRPADQFELPPIDLLSDPPAQVTGKSRDELLAESEVLRRSLEEFGIRGRIGEVHPGPVITRYDFEPAPGVKVNQVVSREDDIALALRSDRVRILSRVPGKAAVGIEIPNDVPALIPFKEVLRSRAAVDVGGVLTLALGKDTAGRPFCDRLEAMPHLLVAGATGSGKSVCVNIIIASLLFRHSPRDLRLIMIDPKMLELTGFNGIPHLALPVVTESKEAAKALNWLVREMERRYRILAARGVRNLATYNERFFPDGEPVKTKDEEEPPERLPYMVCIVDELADLMMQFANEVETPIARLAQMARAVGIHLILATQRPSVDVLTGVIKANFPARIAFQVASRIDSRTIMDSNGAESLIGRGDMLYLPPGRPVPVRLHGAFLPDEDIESLVSYLRGFSSDLEPIDLEEKSSAAGEFGGDEDPLFVEAARLVVLQGQASTSFLQRRLKVGYSRAGRLMDQLEQAGIVGAHEGSKAREVLVDVGFLEEQGII